MTPIDSRAGQIHRGLGVVVRWPGIALVVPSDASHDAVVDDMFEDLGPSPTAEQVVTAINDLLAEDLLKSAGMVVESKDGPVGLAFGAVEVLVDGEVVLSGDRGAARSPLDESAQRFTVRAANLSKAAEPVAPYDLRQGIAPGAGLTLRELALPSSPAEEPKAEMSLNAKSALEHDAQYDAEYDAEPEGEPEPTSEAKPSLFPAAAPSPGPAPDPDSRSVFDPGPAEPAKPKILEEAGDMEPASPAADAIDPASNESSPPPAADFVSIPIAGFVGSADPDSSGLPVAQDEHGTSELPTVAGMVEVEGILCSRKHFNNPANAYCMVCGLPLEHLADERVRGPRPTLGFIVFDNGATYGLDRSYLIGREPKRQPEQTAEPLVIRSDNETLSRTHAELRLVGWQVQLIDLGSTNGTYIWNAPADRWDKLKPNTAVDLSSGATVAVGRRTFVFEGVRGGDPQRVAP